MTEFHQKYNAVFTNDQGVENTIVNNDFNTLSLTIHGVAFEGDEFNDLVVVDKSSYTKAQLNRFSFVEDVLCNYTLAVEIPQTVLDKEQNKSIVSILECKWTVGKQSAHHKRIESYVTHLQVTIDEEVFEGSSDVYIDDAFNQIIEQFGERYAFKNCYGCMFSDYSPYGQQGFGGMFCFVRQKEKYLNVKIPRDSYKHDYISAFENKYEVVQEIYCCKKYEMRKRGTGYRG